MMKAKVRYFGSIRVITKKSEEEVEISSNATVYELLQRLASVYGEDFGIDVFQEDGKNLREDLVVALDRTPAVHMNILNTEIKSDDIITLFPIFPGGG